MICDPIAGAKVSKYWRVELLTVGADQDPGNTKSADDVLEQGLCLDPFGKVVNGHDRELDLTFHHRKWPD